MEASGMAAEAAEDTAGSAVEGAQAPGGGFDLSPVLERFDGLGSRLEQLETRLAASFEPEAEEEPADDGFAFDLDALYGEPAEQAQQGAINPQALQQLMTQGSQAQIERALGPLMQRLESMEVGMEAERLAAKYPELGVMETAQPVVDAAKRLAESAGHPELVNNMEFIELVYKAQRADKYAAGERPVGGEQAFELERAGGSGPAAGDQPNTAERIIADRKGAQAWPPQW